MKLRKAAVALGLAGLMVMLAGCVPGMEDVPVETQLTLSDPASTIERGRTELSALLAFRRAHEREWFANLNHNAWVEDLSWKLTGETKQPAEFYP